jgi:hypothetical protein
MEGRRSSTMDSCWSTRTYIPEGRGIAQAVSRRLPTAAVRVRAHVKSCGICGEQSGTEAGFLRVLRFPLPIFIPPIASHSSSSIIRGWYHKPISGRCTKCTLSHPSPKKETTFQKVVLWREPQIHTLFMKSHLILCKNNTVFWDLSKSPANPYPPSFQKAGNYLPGYTTSYPRR